MSGKHPVGVMPITVPTLSQGPADDFVIVGGLRTHSGPVGIEDRHAHMVLTHDQADVLVRALAAKLGMTIVEPDHDFAPANDDPGHCIICGEYDSDHGYDPERDDFDDEVDTPDDYEGDKYIDHEFEPRTDTPEICRSCQEESDWHYHTEPEPEPTKPYRITSNYGTFEITKVVQAEDEDDAWSHTGIMADLTAAGWTFAESPDGEDHEVEEVTS